MTRRSVHSVGLTLTILFVGLILAPRESVSGAANFPKMDVKLAHVIPAETSINQGALKFSALLKERTGGAVNVQVFPNGQMGSEKDMVEQVRNGLIHMALTGEAFLSNIDGWGPIGVFALPYVLKPSTEDEQLAVLSKLMRGPIMKETTANSPAVSGLRALDTNWFYGMRHLTTGKKQVTKADDLKGMKIRTPRRLPHAAPHRFARRGRDADVDARGIGLQNIMT